MLKNYIKIAIRNLRKQPLYSLINIFGLALGVACCILIMLFVRNEWNFDAFHANSDRLYRAWGHEDRGEDESFHTMTPLILAPTLENYIPEVDNTTRFYNFSNFVKRPEQEHSFSETVSMVDPAFFRMFDFPLIEGNPESVFDRPGSTVITEDIARRYFGERNPIQKTLSIRIGDSFEDFTVAGVVQNPPANSSIQFDILIPFSNSPKLLNERIRRSWFMVVAETYVLLKENTRPSDIYSKLTAMMQGVLGERYPQSNYTVGLQPVTDVHLNTDMPRGIARISDPAYSYILSALSLLILLIACINYMTLSISRSTSRAKEVGIRKTIGARRQHLMYQFWGETLLMTILALALGIIMAELLLPRFNMLSGTELAFTFGTDALIFMSVATIFISLMAGIYPAFILSGFRPVEVLKGRLSLSGDKNFFRQAMIVFQFTLSIALIAGTLIITRQLNYVRSTDLGYQKEQVLVLESGMRTGPGNPLGRVLEEAGRLKDRLSAELRGSAGIEQISMSSFTPAQPGGWVTASFREQDGRPREFHFNVVDYDFINTYEIEVVQGRGFSADNPSDERRAILVNQALVDDYGWENPIGRRLPGPDFEDHEIIGVVENFHYESLYNPVEPLVLTINPALIFSGINKIGLSGSPSPRLSLRLNTENLPSVTDRIKESWTEVTGGTPFNYAFVDQAVDSQYRKEERLSQIVAFGSTLAIVIACMGLFGLASLMIVRRTKEIGIRKVLGASSSHIVLLVNREFTRLVAIAFVIAVPVAWVVMSRWLQDFAYRIDIGMRVFLLAGVAALCVAWLTVSWQSVRAALINPVESLKNE